MDLNHALNLQQCGIDLKKYGDWDNKMPSTQLPPNPYNSASYLLSLDHHDEFPKPIAPIQPQESMSPTYMLMKNQQEQQILLDSSNSNQHRLDQLKQQQAKQIQSNLALNGPASYHEKGPNAFDQTTSQQYAQLGCNPTTTTTAYNTQGEAVNHLQTLYQTGPNKYAHLKKMNAITPNCKQPNNAIEPTHDIYDQTSYLKRMIDPNKVVTSCDQLRQHLKQRQKEILGTKQGIQSYQSSIGTDLKEAYS